MLASKKIRRLGLAVSAVLCVAVYDAAAPLSHRPTGDNDPEFQLRVSLSARELSVLENGEITQTYRVAVGRAEFPTPTGSFRVRRIIWNPRWVPPDASWARDKKEAGPGDPNNPMGKVKIFFSEPDYYIHGTHETDSLGSAESHGCLRMRNSDVIELARAVMAAGGKPVSQSWVRRLINRIRSTREVTLSTPVGITITR